MFAENSLRCCLPIRLGTGLTVSERVCGCPLLVSAYQMSLAKRKKTEHGANDPPGDRVLQVSPKRSWNLKPLSSV